MKLPPTAPIVEASQKNLWTKVITSTPVVMAVLSTLLAGLSSSEMSTAQYFRSIAAQDQSKVGDQWAFFQAKKMRSGSAVNAAELLADLGQANADFSPAILNGVAPGPATNPSRQSLEQLLADPKMQQALKLLARGPAPPVDTSFITDPHLLTAYTALSKGESESIDPQIFQQVSESSVHDALLRAEENTQNVADSLDPTLKSLTKLKTALGKMSAPANATAAAAWRQAVASFSAAQFRFDAARESREAQANQVTAYLYEIQVHKASIQSERHRVRSRYFFYGMLGAQAAVTIATIAIAAREKNTLWSLSAGIGAIAVTYAGYVYLFT